MDICRVVFSLINLAYAGYSDIRRRKVLNIFWLAIAAVSIAFAGYYTMEQDVAKGMEPVIVPFDGRRINRTNLRTEGLKWTRAKEQYS